MVKKVKKVKKGKIDHHFFTLICTPMLSSIYLKFLQFLSEETLPFTVQDITVVSQVPPRYPSFFENHGAKAPFLAY